MKVFSSIKKMISIETPKKKAGSISICILISALIFIAFPAWSADYYIAQSAAGSRGGSSCANAKAITWNWTSPNVIGDDTVHLCGTITSQLSIPQSGTSGHPITIKFETGAKFSSTKWSTTGAIYGSGVSYIVVDGGTNGIVENTANGTLLANQSASLGILFSSSSYIEIKNLTVQNIFVHPYMQGSGSIGTGGIEFDDSSNISAHDCIINNAATGILEWNRSGGTNSNIEFYNLTISRCNWGLAVVAIGGSTESGVKIHNNDITVGSNWVQSDGAYHLNGMYIFGQEVGTPTTFTNFWFYNNYIHGEVTPDGSWTCSGFIHFDYANATGTRIFNNLLVGVSSDPTNGYIALQKLYESAGQIYNNTIIGFTPGGHGILAAQNVSAASWTVRNNIFRNLFYAEAYGANVTWLPDYNSLYGNNYASGQAGTLADWRTYLGGCHGANRDCNSIATNPDLNTNYTPKVTSPVVGAGVNLTSLCGTIPELCRDRNGVARPATGAWDIGAYAYGYNKPKPPRNLRIN